MKHPAIPSIPVPCSPPAATRRPHWKLEIGNWTFNIVNRTFKPILLSLSLCFSLCFSQSLRWAHPLSSTGNVEIADMELGKDGRIYLTGSFEGTVDFDPGPGMASFTSTGSTDMFIAKYDTAGALVWAKAITGSGMDGGTSLSVDKNSNVVVIGTYSVSPDFDPGPGVVTLPPEGSDNGFLAKYDLGGALVWVTPVATGDDAPLHVVIEGDDHILVAGGYLDSTDFDPGPGMDLHVSEDLYDAFLSRFDRFGNHLWTRVVGGPVHQYFFHIQPAAAGMIYLSGSFDSTVDFDPGAGVDMHTSMGIQDFFWTQLDTAGSYYRTITAGGAGWDQGALVEIDPTGNVWMVGDFMGTADFDPGPGTLAHTSTGANPDVYFAKYDPLGNLLFAHALGNDAVEQLNDMDFTPSGDLLLFGNFAYDLDADAGPDSTVLTAAGAADLMVLKYSGATGTFISAASIGGPLTDKGYSLEADPFGHFYLAGNFRDTVDFDLHPATHWLISDPGNVSGFLAKYTDDMMLPAPPAQPEVPFTLFPNPATEQVTLRSPHQMHALTLTNALGQQVLHREFTPNQQHILHLPSLPTGIYLITAHTATGTTHQRLILE